MIMGKGLKSWSLWHLLVLSLALNVGLVMKMAYERESFSRAVEGAQQSIHGRFCEEKHGGAMVEASMAVGSSEIGRFSTSVGPPMASASSDFLPVADDGRVINLDHGDPTMYEKLWRQAGDKTTVVISGWQYVSYFSDPNKICWFLEPTLEKEIIRLHEIVGNAVTEDRYVIVGTGSTQLFQAALYALSPPEETEPISVVSATPYYSFHRQVIDHLKSGLYKWAGDTDSFNKSGPYIELVTSPNNPDGFMRQAKVNRSGGILLHDFAYYWPQYTPITSAADHDLMLFTISKSSGHAGIRIGWALVKDKEVAKKMTKFVELSSIGVSKDSQLRAAKILQAMSDSTEQVSGSEVASDNFFEVSFGLMAERWRQMREAVKKSRLFSLPELPSALCNYLKRTFETQPAFAWLRCEGEIEDCEAFLRGHKILTRSGKHFGMSPKYVRISMLDRDENFRLFLKRLSAIFQR
ncbi:hypothetical protein Nepgr_023347 [Nepenthes gracilis]|uniref:Alliinase C-terminal domain-containing protein n=1 Tax=Nepenthes gracilis TaxID=150966 RepID=A0AAD3T299_NEPGR|nr:hypothetical protein Nepgr_023347 [Nepenthes gracilis]